MIDFENRVYSDLKKALASSHIVGKLSMSTDLNVFPSSFPHVSVIEMDNVTYEKTIDSGSNENHAQVTYEITVYSDSKNGRKNEAKNITNEIDKNMINWGFVRLSKTPISTQSLFRIVTRYQGIISKNFEIYRR